MDTATIKDKIAKLLALADSPDENEAKAALLKARALMAKHKLTEGDCEKAEKAKVINETIGVTCTALTDPWAIQLSAVIAGAYCCKAFHRKYKNGKRYTIGFVGLEDDFEVCKRVFLYAYNTVKAYQKTIQRGRFEFAADHRDRCNAYGYGFTIGVRRAFEEQTKQQQEWGLVMVVPQAVNDATLRFQKRPNPGRDKTGGELDKYRVKGFEDGTNFRPTESIEEGRG